LPAAPAFRYRIQICEMTAPAAPSSSSDTPGVIAPPPVLFAIFFAIAFLLDCLHPLPMPLSKLAIFWPCAIFLNASWPLAIWASAAMHHAGTRINPLRPVTTLVTSGPFRYSRNPLSVSLVLLYLGLAFQINSLWPLFLFPVLLIFNHYGITLREERYLESKFGDTYRQYRTTVRRWL
jgi:protein-S-isoprenylcysteine O-methyltransferase Ste14